MKIEFISRNRDGNYYIGFKVPVKRGIRGKTRGKVDELIIVGINQKQFPQWCKEHNIIVTEVELHDSN